MCLRHMSRATDSERAQRVNSAFALLVRGHSLSEAVQVLTESFALSRRQGLLPAGGAGTRAAAAGCPTGHSRHDQDPRRGRGGVARVCSRKRPDDGRDCRVRALGVSHQGTPTWVIGVGRVMTYLWTMSLTACSPPSLSKSTRSWYRIGHAARGGRPG